MSTELLHGRQLLGKRGTVDGFGERWHGTVVAALNSKGAVVYHGTPERVVVAEALGLLDREKDFLFWRDGGDYSIYCWIGDDDFELEETE